MMEMDYYHFEVFIIQRSRGHSVVKEAAYITKDKLYDNYTGKNYQSKAEHETIAGVALPKHAPRSYSEVQVLLNELNLAEKRKDAQMARLYILSLPNKLTTQQQVELVERFVEEQFIQYGRCAIWGIHLNAANTKGREELPALCGQIEENPHVHILVPFRQIDENGFCLTKINSRTKEYKKCLNKERDDWATIQNQTFDRLGIKARVSARSLVAQGIYRRPAQHLSRAVFEMERRGIRTPAGDRYRERIRSQSRYRDRDHDRER